MPPRWAPRDRRRPRAPARAGRSLPTSAPSYGQGAAGLHLVDLYLWWREPAQLGGRAREHREGAVVAGNATLRPEQLERDGRLARAHRVVVADREDRDVGRVDAA